ncbi:MAG TPA: extracellular solute-binding protein [Xanthobacteraceae bacterium]|nr:extracellular solute-binding protein [Xanthobacteraceae bacterium]
MRTACCALVAAVTTIGIAFAVPAHAQSRTWDDVVAAAKKEGSVTIYHANLGAPHWKKAVAAFKARYGIDVKEFDARASEMSERIRTEQESGRFIADLELHGYTTVLDQMKTNYVAELGDIPNAVNLRDDVPRIPDRGVPVWVQHSCLLVNTNLVKPADEPKSYAELTDPKWKGRMMSDEMRAIGGGNTFFGVVGDKLGLDYMRKLKAQDLLFDRDLQQSSRRIARGERALLLQQIVAFASALKGLPVKVVVPDEGCPGTPIQGAILRGAPHPNAARVFINHFLDMETQVTYGEAWMGTVIKGVAARLTDPEAKRFADIKTYGYVTPEIREWSFKQAAEMFK